MKKHFYILMLFISSFFYLDNIYSQVEKFESGCKEKFINFHDHITGKSKTKDYKKAYEQWLICFQDCPQYSERLYKHGNIIIRDLNKNPSLAPKEQLDSIADKLYRNWIKYYPKNSAKIYDYWASSLRQSNKEKSLIYKKLDSAYKINPLSLSIKNLQIYLESRIENEEDIEKSINFYDDVLESINIRKDSLSKQLSYFEIKEEQGEQLSSKEKLIKKNNSIVLKGLGRTQTMIDMILNQKYSLNCDNLTSIYKNKFEHNANNAKWLKRVLSRLFIKDCNNDFIKKLIQAQENLKLTTPEALIIYHNNDQRTPYIESPLKEFIDKEKDVYEKANIYYKIALSLKNKSKSMSRQYAYKALKERSNFGKAYLLIAKLYAMSANKCGKNEFEKRMVFFAAVDKLNKAKEVDPSITSLVNKYIKSYLGNTPSIRSSIEYQVKCWINETVKIP